VGNLGPEVHDQTLRETFQKYPSYIKSRVIRDSRTSRSKGYGFVSFKDAEDYSKAFREINGLS
jgi:RNA recognition motif-containing protein